MWNTFKYTVITLMREKGIIIWVVLFPIVLSTVFSMMFTSLDEVDQDFEPIPVAIVEDDAGIASMAFDTMMATLAGEEATEGGAALLDPVYASSEEEALALLKTGEVFGIVTLDGEGWPHLEMTPVSSADPNSRAAINRTILADVMDNFTRTRIAYEDIAAASPAFFASEESVVALAEASEMTSFTANIAVTHEKAAESVRYFYALLGFTALMAAMVGLEAVGRAQANISPLGARRMTGATSRAKMLAGSVAGAWAVSFAALVIGFCYMRFVLGVGFGGREAVCLVALAAAALMSTSFGAFIGALPGIPFEGKGGLISGITCAFSLFAGLYGQPSLALADEVARNAPVFAAVNPVKQVTDLFYSLYVYTDLTPFFQTLGAVVAIAAVLALVAALLMRRQSYAHL